ncbi:MAG: AAA family ATPase, partial [Acidimicrobiales bacterium]
KKLPVAVFIAIGEHCYPIMDKITRFKIIRGGNFMSRNISDKKKTVIIDEDNSYESIYEKIKREHNSKLILKQSNLEELFKFIIKKEGKICGGVVHAWWPKYNGNNMIEMRYNTVDIYANPTYDIIKKSKIWKKYYNAADRLGKFVKNILNGWVKEHGLQIKSRYNEMTVGLRCPLVAKKWCAFDIKEDDLSSICAIDCRRCYPNALINNVDPFCIMGVCDEVVKIDDEYIKRSYKEIPVGWYWIKTDDMMIFNGDGIYTRRMVIRAIKEGVIFKCEYMCVPLYTLRADAFKGLFTKIYEEPDYSTAKIIAVNITGLFGKRGCTKLCKRFLKVGGELWLRFKENAWYFDDKFAETETGVKVGCVAWKNEMEFSEDTMSIYNQMMCEYYLMLYDMIRLVRYKPIRIKTDCVYWQCSVDEVKNMIGDDICARYKIEEPEVGHKQDPVLNRWNQPVIDSKEWVEIDGKVKNSDDRNKYIEKVIEHLESGRSLMVVGSGGTGKTMLVGMEICNRLGNKVGKFAYTNVAAMKIEGKTFHSGFGMDWYGHKSNIKKWDNNMNIIMCDEISMYNNEIWTKLKDLKDMGKILLLIGDWKQVSPIFEKNGLNKKLDFENSWIVWKLADGCKTVLNECVRSDSYSFKILQDISKIKWKEICCDGMSKYNLCAKNTTRIRINKLVNDKIARNETWKYIKKGLDDLCQSMKVYEGLDIMAIITVKRRYVNGQRFVVKKMNEKNVVIEAHKGSENIIKYDELKNNFVMAYCITVHKSQCNTIDGVYTIYDWECMDEKLRYTALSRTTNIANVVLDIKGKKYIIEL